MMTDIWDPVPLDRAGVERRVGRATVSIALLLSFGRESYILQPAVSCES
jgi:hypothetical protein